MLFASFVAGSARYQAIYSSFAIGIIMLIWIYLNWLILLVGASIVFYLQNPNAVAKRYRVRFSPELQEHVAMVLMWLVCKPFSEGRPAPRQEKLEYQLGVPGEVTRRVSDKLIRGKLLVLTGETCDALMPARALDKITVGDVMSVVRADEDRLMRRLPKVLPESMLMLHGEEDGRTFAELIQADVGRTPPAL